ncbi:TetR/AcrR family transcriptional regulator [Cryptosporangium aurantiacum]|uniref:Transcriptional regulator, TetR family n=1 Tax=Cryptosporangium aurantiacum TaxID=134849 RepID=A0A1M7RL48_9ACTN|nr:TetR/AcrR family transcriptional regulator [Cryptosporangium aurantiacum]SHN46871.1 transcriptional regulator, TetR family [Cryptosporangium aurantiacum]
MPSTGLSGRKAQAARNDQTILAAAREVFLHDPTAPMSAVAEAAHVGIGALYRRYASKEQLLRTLCAAGLQRFVEIAEHGATVEDAWEAFAGYVSAVVDSDVHSLTVHLAGTFTTTPELSTLAGRAAELGNALFRRAQEAGALRPDLHPADVPMLFEQLAAIRFGDNERTAALRRRYLTLLLDALRPESARTPLPGEAPTPDELSGRWRPTEPA